MQAETTALSFTGGIITGNDNTTSGWGFSLSSPVLLTDLGVWDYLNSPQNMLTIFPIRKDSPKLHPANLGAEIIKKKGRY